MDDKNTLDPKNFKRFMEDLEQKKVLSEKAQKRSNAADEKYRKLCRELPRIEISEGIYACLDVFGGIYISNYGPDPRTTYGTGNLSIPDAIKVAKWILETFKEFDAR